MSLPLTPRDVCQADLLSICAEIAERQILIDQLVESARRQPSAQISEDLRRLARSGNHLFERLLLVRHSLDGSSPVSLLG